MKARLCIVIHLANFPEISDADDSSEEGYIKKSVFYVLLENVIRRFNTEFGEAVGLISI